MRNNLPVTGREYKLGTNDFLISRTDRGGRITYANHAFIEASGFSREELLGQPHNIVRHPDMPREAFADLWKTLKSGETWVGLVKNRRKNGDHYWVYAHVAPITEDGELQGYVSMRTKADDAAIDNAQAVYRSVRDGDAKNITIHRGQVRHRSILGWVRHLDPRSVGARLALFCATSMLLLVISTALGLYRGAASEMAGGALWVAQWAVLAGGLGILARMCLTASRAITAPLDRAMKFTVQIAAGNLAAASPPVERSDEIGRLLVALDVMRKSLNSIVGYVHKNVSVVEPEAHDIACGNEDLSTRTEQQAGFLQDTASSMEQIMAAAEQNAHHATDASQLVAKTTTVVKESGELMNSVVATMDRISDGSNRIATIVDVIDSIAFQTNILALNASVEAARAGESGRGFAVVAGEVRNLAGRSAEAAREIRSLIDTSSTEVADGAHLVERAEKAIEEVVVSVTRVNELMGEIAVASSEQSIGIGGVNSSVVEMDLVTQQNTNRVQQTARAAAVLDHQISELAYAMKVFRVNSGVECARSASSATKVENNADTAKKAVA